MKISQDVLNRNRLALTANDNECRMYYMYYRMSFSVVRLADSVASLNTADVGSSHLDKA